MGREVAQGERGGGWEEASRGGLRGGVVADLANASMAIPGVPLGKVTLASAMCPWRTRVKASFSQAVGVPRWTVRVTSVVPDSYCRNRGEASGSNWGGDFISDMWQKWGCDIEETETKCAFAFRQAGGPIEGPIEGPSWGRE